jgi:phosphoglycolate phosphatase-like HAD superfamily hydrolase
MEKSILKLNKFVTDIDNTIADTSARLRRSLQEVGREEVYEKTSCQFGGFSDYLNAEELERLWGIFLSGRFLYLDEPVPAAAKYLTRLVEDDVELIYLTGRHDESGDTMRPGTVDWLEKNGFPPPGQDGAKLYMKPERSMNDMEFKLDCLEELLRNSPGPDGVVGVGDHPNDAVAYGSSGIKPYLLSWPDLFDRDELEDSADGVEVVENWTALGKKLTLNPPGDSEIP